uniref:Uncharacterized protein n=1 Tax=Solanum lycopersicum TaxID=4081 RepID=A0A3Q7FPG7_SOLLC
MIGVSFSTRRTGDPWESFVQNIEHEVQVFALECSILGTLSVSGTPKLIFQIANVIGSIYKCRIHRNGMIVGMDHLTYKKDSPN